MKLLIRRLTITIVIMGGLFAYGLICLVYLFPRNSEAVSDPEEIQTSMELVEMSTFETDAYSTQGVTWDGTYFYVSGSGPDKIYKYDASGTKIADRDVTMDGSNHHLGDLVEVDGVLYVTSSDYPNSPYNQYVKEYNASDLSYRDTEYFIDEDFVGEGIDYSGGYFWTVSNNNVVQRWGARFTDPTTYTADHVPYGFISSHGWQGLNWHNGYLYLNTHELNLPSVLVRYRLEGTELIWDSAFPRPKWASQGFDIKPDGTFILGVRGYGASSKIGKQSDAVTIAELIPYDFRDEIIRYTNYPTEVSTSSGGYVEVSESRVKIYAKKWDIVEVHYEANFRTSSGTMRAYIDSSSSSIYVEPLNSATSMRTGNSSTEGVKLSQTRSFIVLEDGIVVIGMKYKKNGAGIVYVRDQSAVAKIVGRYTD